MGSVHGRSSCVGSRINGCEILISRSVSVTDDCGNSASFGQLVHVLDTTNPEVESTPENLIISCLDEIPAIDEEPVFSDNCDAALTIVPNEYTEDLDCGSIIYRTWTATDACGNTAQAVQTITIIDEIDPVINPYEPFVTFECAIPEGFVGITAYDSCGEVTIDWSETETSGGCLGYRLRDYVVTDECGNTSTAQIIIHLIDETGPTIVAPESYTVQCYDAPTEMPTVEIFDNCDNNPELLSATSEIVTVDDCTYQIVWQWIAQDDCFNESIATTVVTVTDTESPWLENVPADASYACNEIWSVQAPTAGDYCHNAEVIEEELLVLGDCPNEYSIIYSYYAIDDCGNMSATASVTVTIYDNSAPTFNGNLLDQYFDCLDIDSYQPQVVTAQDNCPGQVDVDMNIIPLTEGSCGSALYEVVYTATDACGNWNETSYMITVSDETDPQLMNCPENVSIPCDGAIPAAPVVTAYDACSGDLIPQLQVTYSGDVPTPGSIADCNILTPVRPNNNPCKYPVDWAMAMFSMPKVHRFYKVSNGNFVQFPNGTIQVTATFYNAYNVNNGWTATMTFTDGMAWAAWSNQTFPTNFKADCGGVAANHFDWMYYRLLDTPGVELVGYGAYAGSSLSIKHAPSNKYFGFQLGVGANNYNNSYGFGGWFSYQGQFYINGTPYNSNGNIMGGGDFAFTLDCCPNYQIHRTWTATDCSGNSATCSQTVTIGTPPAPVALVDEIYTDVNQQTQNMRIQPNPTQGATWFYFTAQFDGHATLELYDMTGKKIKDIFVNEVAASEEYGVEYDAAHLSTGIYMYRLTNGDYKEIGKLIVNK
jgi:Secretion system C-terminal sorting domain